MGYPQNPLFVLGFLFSFPLGPSLFLRDPQRTVGFLLVSPYIPQNNGYPQNMSRCLDLVERLDSLQAARLHQFHLSDLRR